MGRTYQNILVIRFSALGDVAMTIPAIYSVGAAYPHVKLHMLTTSPNNLLFVNRSDNILIHHYSRQEIRGIFGTIRLLKDLSKMPIDAVADLHNVLRSWVIDAFFFLCGKKISILNKMRKERRAILYKHKDTSIPYSKRYFHVFARLGLACEPSFKGLYKDFSPALPNGFSKQSQKIWIGIAPFARYENKTYPLSQMREVVFQLASSEEKEIFLFGSAGTEAQLLNAWCKKSNVHCIAGLLTLDKELALMSQMNVMVTMDSANMHLASLVGVRVISIWGSTTPACGFLGWGQKSDDAIMADLSCQPCTISGSCSCRNSTFSCLKKLSPNIIIEKILKSL